MTGGKFRDSPTASDAPAGGVNHSQDTSWFVTLKMLKAITITLKIKYTCPADKLMTYLSFQNKSMKKFLCFLCNTEELDLIDPSTDWVLLELKEEA